MALQGLIDVAMTGRDHCPLEEYVNGEDDIPVCLDACSDTWEEEFFDNLGQEDQGEDQDEEDSDSEQPSPEFEPPQSKIKSYKEAILSLEEFNFSLNLEGVYKIYTSGEFYGQFICCTDTHCKTDHSSRFYLILTLHSSGFNVISL